MRKACSKCGRIHDYNFKCTVGNNERYQKGAEEDKLRSSYKWKKKRTEIKESSFYLCEVCKDRGDFRVKPVEVHHIKKLKDNLDLFVENENLVTLCIDHHKEAERGIISAEYLAELVKKREGYE